jgi:DNA-binding NarL/FixJ family response regulator
LKQRAQGTRVVSETIRLVIADDHPVVRDGLRAMLDTQPNIEVVGEAGTGAEALSLVRSLRPDLVLMDLQMPELDGASATRRIKAEHKDVQVLVLITYDTDADISRAVEAGATGYLLKDARREEVFNAVRLAARGESVLSPGGGLARAGEDARPRRRVAEHP